jgi:hypothetical protein
VALVTSLAGQMSVSVQNGLLLRDRVAVARIEEEMNLARSIQSRFLPSRFPRIGRFEVHAVNSPSRQVGGDFYDFVPLGESAFYLAIADVSGKGVPAALLTSMLQASLRTQADSADSVSGILGNINHLVTSSTSIEQFATFFLARVDSGHSAGVLQRGQTIQGAGRTGSGSSWNGAALFWGSRTAPEEGVDLSPGDRVFFTPTATEANAGTITGRSGSARWPAASREPLRS